MELGRPARAGGGSRLAAVTEIRVAKLGTHKRPAVVRVQSTEEAEELISLAAEHGWTAIVGVEPDQVEDVSEPFRQALYPRLFLGWRRHRLQ